MTDSAVGSLAWSPSSGDAPAVVGDGPVDDGGAVVGSVGVGSTSPADAADWWRQEEETAAGSYNTARTTEIVPEDVVALLPGDDDGVDEACTRERAHEKGGVQQYPITTHRRRNH